MKILPAFVTASVGENASQTRRRPAREHVERRLRGVVTNTVKSEP